MNNLINRLESLRSWITGLKDEAPAIRNQAAILINDCIAALSDLPAAKAGPSEPCRHCRGAGVVDDGAIYHSGGAEFANGPIQCVKDCPSCGGSGIEAPRC